MGKYTTTFVPSVNFIINGIQFPYALIEGKDLSWLFMTQLTDEEIVYDGRKEEKMYKVTQEFMHELIEWRDDNSLDVQSDFIDTFVDGQEIGKIPGLVDAWWTDSYNSIENNNRLIAIIQWLNGEDVFEVEKPHKFVVRSDKYNYIGDYTYVAIRNYMTTTTRILSSATKLNTREEAQEWANSHQVVVEIDEEGNEVE